MRSVHRLVAAVVLLPLLAGCGSAAEKGGPVVGHPAEPGGDGVVTVHVQDVPGSPLFTEGYVPHVRLIGSSGQSLRPADDHHPVFTGLAPGTYVVQAAVRPCDGNCGLLDPAQDQCRRNVQVVGSVEVTMLVRPGKPCHLRLGSAG